MNIYKNLMFLQGHFVDPRDADEEPAAPAPRAAPVRARAAPADAGPSRWRRWFARTPESAQRKDACGDAHGCA